MYLYDIILEYPLIFGSPYVNVTYINTYSILFHVSGSDPEQPPYLLASHLDVVPVNIESWTFDPFNAGIQNGNIIGRGAIDDKHGVFVS